MTDERIAFGTSRARWVLAATALGSGMAFLDGTVVNVALPAMGEEFDAEVAGLQWIVNAYMLPLAALILLSGSLGDRLGRRRVFVVGVIWFAIASVICTVAPNIEVMIVGRVLQGVGGALLTPGSLAILQTSFAQSDRGKAVGAWSGLTSVAAAVGPFVGGSLVDSGSWRLIFLLNIPIALVTVLITLRHVPESRDETATGKLDIAGAVLATTGLAGLTFGLISAGDHGFGDPLVLGSLAVGVVALAVFVEVERRSSHPMLPPGMFANIRFTGANLVTGRCTAVSVQRPSPVVYLQTVLGYPPSGRSRLAADDRADARAVRYAGGLADRIGARIPMTVGPAADGRGLLADAADRAGRELRQRGSAGGRRTRPGAGRDRRTVDRHRAVLGRGSPRRDGVGGEQRGRPLGAADGRRRDPDRGRDHRGLIPRSGCL